MASETGSPPTTIGEVPEPSGDPRMIRAHADFLEREIRFSEDDVAWLRAAADEIARLHAENDEQREYIRSLQIALGIKVDVE